MSSTSLQSKFRTGQPVAAPPTQRDAVSTFFASIQQLAVDQPEAVQSCILEGPQGERIPVPSAVFLLLERATEILAHGDAITLLPVSKALTTQQAADILNMSRQYLVQLLESGEIPYTKTGKHRRLRLQDVLEYKERRDRTRRRRLQELTAASEELGGYPELEDQGTEK